VAVATVVGLQLTTDVAHAAQSQIALVNARVTTRSAAERPSVRRVPPRTL